MAMSEKAKKRLKRELIEGIIAVIIILCCYFGCEAYIDKQVQEWNAIEYIGISNGVKYRNKVHFKTVDEVTGYEITQNYYSSEIYYAQLNEQEKFVYDTYKYAFENNITHLFFEEELISECNYTLREIFIMFTLDTPLMEQSIVCGEDKGNYTIDNQFLYKKVQRELKGSYINIENFTKEKAEKKQKAIKKAKQIKFDFTDDMTEYDKAKMIYTYLGENIKYVNDDSENRKKVIMKTHYLYDALCKNETNCDGFANAFSLLCNMNGIKSFEKKDNPPENKSGHTWNAVLLDGVWYNVDATGAEEVTADNWTKDLYSRFAYSDKTQTEKPMFSKITPECKNDSIFVGCTLNTCYDEGAARKVAEAYRSTEDDFFVVIIKKATEEEIDDLMQDVADYLWTGFQTSTLDGKTKKLVYINK